MRNKAKPTKHFKRLLHFADNVVWSWRLKRRGSRDNHTFEEGIQVRSPEGVDTFIDRRNFVKNRPYFADPFGWTCDCEECRPSPYIGGYEPGTIKNYIETVIINKQSWKPNL